MSGYVYYPRRKAGVLQLWSMASTVSPVCRAAWTVARYAGAADYQGRIVPWRAGVGNDPLGPTTAVSRVVEALWVRGRLRC